LIQRLLERLVRFKNSLNGDTTDPFAVETLGGDVGDEPVEAVEDEPVDDGRPLTWAEQKCIRTELRRFQLWHALRMKVPRGFEEGV